MRPFDESCLALPTTLAVALTIAVISGLGTVRYSALFVSPARWAGDIRVSIRPSGIGTRKACPQYPLWV